MSLLDICSNNSYWRGLDYFENNKVKSIKKINDNEYEAIVLGSKEYNVHLNILHPKKSTCTCPHATGKSIICKHKVAVFFALFPDEVQKAIDIRNEYYIEQEEKEKYLDNRSAKRTCINRIKLHITDTLPHSHCLLKPNFIKRLIRPPLHQLVLVVFSLPVPRKPDLH